MVWSEIKVQNLQEKGKLYEEENYIVKTDKKALNKLEIKFVHVVF